VAVWRWPLEGGRPTVVRGFEPPPEPWMAGHRGVDLVPAAGDLVVAAGAGVVRFAGMVVDRPVVSIGHADGLITTYEPVLPMVKAGDTVEGGQPIGQLLGGHAGCGVACLHWGLRQGTSYLDPLALIGRVRVRLLPLT
jgi:murein DD-endopeptidase MepM/ murein hydrolase activator NlpD